MEKSGSGRGVMRWEGSEAQAGLTGCTNAEVPLRLQRSAGVGEVVWDHSDGRGRWLLYFFLRIMKLWAEEWCILITVGTSVVVQWLRLWAPDAEGLGSILGQGARSHMLQLRARRPQLKILHAATKTQCSQVNKYKKNYSFCSVENRL